MTSTDSVHNIEEAPSVPSDPHGEDVLTPVGTEDPLGVYHRETRGGELIPRSPLEAGRATVIATCALFHLSSGTLMTLLGMLVHGLMGKYSTKHGPVLWWGGLGPFILGVLGFYAASSRSRRYTYVWGISSLLLAVTQTAIMGWVGNFTTSHYDVWPLHAWRNGMAVCSMRGRTCYCQDYYQGVYSNMELPDVHYVYKDGVKWRQTVYDTCNHLGAITMLFWCFHACWVIFIISSFVSCGVAFAGSVCAKQDGNKFERLKPEGDEDEENLVIDTTDVTEEHSTEAPDMKSTVEVHSRF